MEAKQSTAPAEESRQGLSLEEQKLTDTISETFAVLTDPAHVSVRRMREEHFVRVFLPIFAGEENLYATQGASLDMWRTEAGGPFLEVAIVDTRGQELFRVPPLFNSTAMKPLDGTGKADGIRTLADVIARASLIAKQGPLAMNNYITGEFQEREFMFASTKDESDYIRRWNDILARYNRPPLNLPTTPTVALNVIVDDNEEPEFVDLG